MRVLVTGATGFIGAYTVRALVEAGFEVHGVDLRPASPARPLPPGVRLHRLDVVSEPFLRLVRRLRPDGVVHLAAQTRVAESVRDPEADFAVNVAATARLVRAAAEAGCRRFVFASSAAVYGDPPRLPVDEEAPCRPRSPYGLHKLLAETYVRAWAEAQGMESVVLRYANVYGPGQAPDLEGGVVAVFVERIRRRLPLPVHGDGLQTRDFVYVEDVARANLLALTAPIRQAVCNVSTGRETSVRQLAEAVAAAAGLPVPPIEPEPARPGDVRRSALAPDAARRLLGWIPQVELAAGLRRCLDTVAPLPR